MKGASRRESMSDFRLEFCGQFLDNLDDRGSVLLILVKQDKQVNGKHLEVNKTNGHENELT